MSSSLLGRRAIIVIGAAASILGVPLTDASATILTQLVSSEPPMRREEDALLSATSYSAEMDIAGAGSDSDETSCVRVTVIDDWGTRYPAPTGSPFPPDHPISTYLKSLSYKVPRYVRGSFRFTSTPSRPRGLGSARKRGIVGVRKCRTRLRQRRKK